MQAKMYSIEALQLRRRERGNIKREGNKRLLHAERRQDDLDHPRQLLAMQHWHYLAGNAFRMTTIAIAIQLIAGLKARRKFDTIVL